MQPVFIDIAVLTAWDNNKKALEVTMRETELVAEYASRPTPFPPIELLSPGNPSILNGNHRVCAAILRGDKQIAAIYQLYYTRRLRPCSRS